MLPLVRALFLTFTQVFHNACVVGFFPCFSTSRLTVLPLIVVCVYRTLPICLEATGRVIWAALLGAHSVSFVVQYIDTAPTSQWGADAAARPRRHPGVRKERSTVQPLTPQSKILGSGFGLGLMQQCPHEMLGLHTKSSACHLSPLTIQAMCLPKADFCFESLCCSSPVT